jgi:hypothetical protein
MMTTICRLGTALGATLAILLTANPFLGQSNLLNANQENSLKLVASLETGLLQLRN